MINSVKINQPNTTILNSNTFTSKKFTYSAIKDIFQKSESFNQIPFAGINKTQKFKLLPKHEQINLLKLAKRLLNEKNAGLTLIGKKPGALIVVSKTDLYTLNKHKNLLDSDKYKIVCQHPDTIADKERSNIYLINIEQQKEIIEKNINFYRHKLNNKNLNTDETLKILTGKDSPLFDLNNYHDLVGVTIGFPVADTFVYSLSRTVISMIKDLEQAGQGKTNQAFLLKLVEAVLKPALPGENPHLESKATLYSLIQKIGINLPIPKPISANDCYTFITWDKNAPEVINIQQNADKWLQELCDKFKKPIDLLQYMLNA